MATLDRAKVEESIEALRERFRRIHTEEGRMKGVNFVPRPSDVFVVTPPKAGTTWIQQILHGLRTNGSMDFDEISLVIPMIERAHDYGYLDLDMEQVAQPRMYKTHLWYRDCPKGARYIFVARDPKDMCVSFYHFKKNWMFDEKDIPLDDFVEGIMLSQDKPATPMTNASLWQIIVSWWPHRNDSNVLWLHYDDLHENLAACVKLIAEFIGVGADDEDLQQLVVKQASLDFMMQHHSQFDEHQMKLGMNEAMGLPRNAGMGSENPGKVRTGTIGGHRDALSSSMIEKLDKRWALDVEPVTGYQSYNDLRNSINKELGRPFGTKY